MHFESPSPGPSSANYREYFAELCRELPPLPGEDPEARLAVRVVSTDAHAADALRSAAFAADDPEEVRRCRAQATSMMRQSDAALRSLLRIETTREKQLAAMHPAAMGRAGYWFEEVSVPAPPLPPTESEAEPVRDIKAEANMYAIMYPDRAAGIRAAGGLPPKLDFGPPEPELVEAIVHGPSPGSWALSVPHDATASQLMTR
jgi:hypothetical protein